MKICKNKNINPIFVLTNKNKSYLFLLHVNLILNLIMIE
ncbi:hypothetical protein KL86DYS2_12595 [uncultured Dysgonomonas sp.]|uniref:Uncharacterized protein n=1 Tax=uncultured Dysgonomonas sp. TaxID=206096 RepID=A0A212JY50_9BACT|nr:hypothetical protein KL86DYS2_12595 [uncultured Dysgonomonas sp.]